MSRRIGPLMPGLARRTLAHRFAKKVDRLRQLNTTFGLRHDRVFLVWTRYTGEVRGEGDEVEVARLELLPTPRVSDHTTIQFAPYSAGILPVGSVTVDQISAQMSEEVLMGKRVPDEALPPGSDIPQPTDFFYEIVADDRSVEAPAGCGPENEQMALMRGSSVTPRSRFRIAATPERMEGKVQMKVALERISEDRAWDGTSRIGTDPEDD